MRVPLSWLRSYAAVPETVTAQEISDALIRVGLEVETVDQTGADVTGPLVIGQVEEFQEEKHSNGKTVRWCRVDVGEHNAGGKPTDFSRPGRGIICGASNFAVGDLVVVALPGAVLPGGFEIASRKTYGHFSDGMICSARELGVGDDHAGIMVLTPDTQGPELVEGPGIIRHRPPAPLTVGADAAPAIYLRDDVLDIAVTPDRGYCWSVRGIAREAALALDVDFTDPVSKIPDLVEGSAVRSAGYPVTINSDGCSIFVALTITDLDPTAPSPRWMQRRLHQAGMRSISLAVDITNYVMLESGQPLHAYDAAKLSGPIVVRNAQPGEKLITLDDVTRDLDPADLLITDDRGPIGLAGVMGGADTEVDDRTDTVVIEAANFEAVGIARTSRRHKLISEASRRFERGADPAATYSAAHRAAQLLVALGHGRLSSEETVAGAVPAAPQVGIDDQLPARIMGAPIDHGTVVDHLQRVGVAVADDGERLTLTPPSWRPDLTDPYDFVEEVGRIYGYQRVEPVVPSPPPGRGLSRRQRLRRWIGSALADTGHVEVLTFPFMAPTVLDQLGVPTDDVRRRLLRLANPLSEEQAALRSTLLPELFAAVNRNTSRSIDDLALYEIGSVFLAPQGSGVAPRVGVEHRPTDDELAAMDAAIGDQPRMLGAVLTGHARPNGWTGRAEPVSWRHAVAVAEIAARAVGATIRIEQAEHAPWHPGRCAAVVVVGPDGTGTSIGYAGELHPTVIDDLRLPKNTVAVEVDLDALIAAAPEIGRVADISTHPVVKQDLALIVADSVPSAAVEQALRAGAGALLEEVRLFDIYTGDQLGDGRKSLAYALRFRAPDRTLTDAEVAEVRQAAVDAAAAATGAEQRVI
ncbi:phenylalanine--tRNA ligase subunit beta [Microlunatus soli]|uniref:Phenylalanine--tRNA ligase beta subunit n=1 Tax=Microlunatus soli TaxID=630515 RepID=A0A1H1XYB8_9ACTN|nr:phenylalanine--tRNA ligase subunit beta [Microlunatus soli]SDT13746.1 phenylalanyl-tRNA synthetase beta subunit [Microlunatus soli]